MEIHKSCVSSSKKVQEQKNIIERSLGDLNGFVEHLEEYRIAGKIYAENVMEAGLVKNLLDFKN